MNKDQIKSFPENYSSDAVRVLDAMSFTKGKGVGLLGSMSIRSQQYAGDYDAFEVVNMDEDSDKIALHMLAVRWKEIIRDLMSMPNTYIGDIKSGSIEEWRVIPKEATVKNKKVVGMDVVASKSKLAQLRKENIITEKEEKDALQLLSGKMTPLKLLEAKAELKFHIVRWTPSEILRGEKELRGGRMYTIEEGFSSPTITKLDVISLVQNNRYTDFSMVYNFMNKGRLLNPDLIDVVHSLKENIILYKHQGKYFKVLKRYYALAKFLKKGKVIEALTPILNSDLGRLYHITSDIGTLITLLEEHKPDDERVRFEIDQFIARLSNVYQLKDYLRKEHKILGLIQSILKDKKKETMIKKLEQMNEELSSILNKHSKNIVDSL